MGTSEEQRNRAIDVEIMLELFRTHGLKKNYPRVLEYTASINNVSPITMRRAYKRFCATAHSRVNASADHYVLQRKEECDSFLRKSRDLSRERLDDLKFAIDVELIQLLLWGECRRITKHPEYWALRCAARINRKQLKTIQRCHKIFGEEGLRHVQAASWKSDDQIRKQAENCKQFLADYGYKFR